MWVSKKQDFFLWGGLKVTQYLNARGGHWGQMRIFPSQLTFLKISAFCQRISLKACQ